MTNECRIKYIQYLQCNYSDLAQSLTNKAKLGRKCKELETKMLVVRDYIKSLYCYNAGQSFTLASKVCLSELPESNIGTIDFTLTIGTETYNYSVEFSPNYYTNFLNQVNTTAFPAGVYVVVNTSTGCLEVYSTVLSGEVSVFVEYGEGINFIGEPVTTIPDSILDKVNCLTEKEMCGIVHHAFELVKDCKECC